MKVKQRSEHRKRFPFNSTEVKRNVVSVVREVKQRSEHSEIFHFNSSEAKQCSQRSQRYHFKISEV